MTPVSDEYDVYTLDVTVRYPVFPEDGQVYGEKNFIRNPSVLFRRRQYHVGKKGGL